MPTSTLSPRFTVTADRLHGCTPWLARFLTLFSYGRCLSINKRLGHLIVSTQKLWFLRNIRVINFDRISHVIYEAQALPRFIPWRFLVAGSSDGPGWSFFIVALALKDGAGDVQLFTIWQAQPKSPDWLDALAGDAEKPQGIGDESAREFVDALRELTGISIVPKPGPPMRR